jgi:hypothetical protein
LAWGNVSNIDFEKNTKANKMDFTECLNERYELEKTIIEKLPLVKLSFDTLTIDCSELPNTLDEMSDTHSFLNSLSVLDRKSVVYYFKISCPTNNSEIFNALQNYKKNGINNQTRSCPKLPKYRKDSHTEVLYVGSVKGGFRGRLVQHFGYAHPGTFGLQLIHWGKAIDLKLILHYSVLNDVDIVRHVEAALAKNLNPLVGKREE